MLSLFPEEPALPSGFMYVDSILSLAEEKSLIELVESSELHTMMFHGFEAKRKTANFGYDWSFESRVLTKGADIPHGFRWLIERAAATFSFPAGEVSELLLTEYPPGAVINWHRDAPPFDKIIGVSLLSDCVFRFRPYDKKMQHRKAIINFPVKRCSAYILSGDARSAWEHSIAPVKEKRYSVTLRTLR